MAFGGGFGGKQVSPIQQRRGRGREMRERGAREKEKHSTSFCSLVASQQPRPLSQNSKKKTHSLRGARDTALSRSSSSSSLHSEMEEDSEEDLEEALAPTAAAHALPRSPEEASPTLPLPLLLRPPQQATGAPSSGTTPRPSARAGRSPAMRTSGAGGATSRATSPSRRRGGCG